LHADGVNCVEVRKLLEMSQLLRGELLGLRLFLMLLLVFLFHFGYSFRIENLYDVINALQVHAFVFIMIIER